MSNDIIFEEVQGPGRKSLRDFFSVLAGILLAALVFRVFRQRGGLDTWSTGLLTGLAISVLVAIFSSTRLVTQVRRDGIYVRYPPFQPSFTRFGWEDIRECYMREYD